MSGGRRHALPVPGTIPSCSFKKLRTWSLPRLVFKSLPGTSLASVAPSVGWR